MGVLVLPQQQLGHHSMTTTETYLRKVGVRLHLARMIRGDNQPLLSHVTPMFAQETTMHLTDADYEAGREQETAEAPVLLATPGRADSARATSAHSRAARGSPMYKREKLGELRGGDGGMVIVLCGAGFSVGPLEAFFMAAVDRTAQPSRKRSAARRALRRRRDGARPNAGRRARVGPSPILRGSCVV